MEERMHDDEEANAVGIFHVNLNCTDLERSTAFYELIGFRVITDFDDVPAAERRSFDEIGLAPILRVPAGCAARARLLMLGDDPRATRLDLIEWTQPPTHGTLPGDLTAVGVARLCLRVRDASAMHARLAAAGHDVFTEPVEIDMGGTRQKVFCCADPDGFAVEFMEFLRDGGR
jgi:catechol 2,3-dioxygenase-like lactoylglutathione lyase family enzyme